jgi:predicted metallo-beta-lactamase superfamily hydrolase
MRRKVSELSVKEKELYDNLSIELKDIKKSIRNSSRRKTSSLIELKEHFDKIIKAAELMHEINKIIYSIK